MKQTTRYKEIALDIAKQIVKGSLAQGEKVKGRSVLASNYNVSPETIRKAIALLEEMEVVQSIPGSGIIILSKAKAQDFLNRYQARARLENLKFNLSELLNQKNVIEEAIEKNLKELMDHSILLADKNSEFAFIEIKIKGTNYVGKSIAHSSFWQDTKATIIAIRREDDLMVSPDPDEILLEEDIVVGVKSRRV